MRPKAELTRRDFLPDPRLPLHGALVGVGRATSFVVPQAISVAHVHVNGAALLVHANTGLWLHDGATLAQRVRILPPPIDAMAASPDGALIATVTGSTLEIRKLEGMAVKATVRGVDPPYRIRFSPDGGSVVIASRKRETVTLVDVATGTIKRHDTHDDVNDAIVLPDGEHVAYANDGDEAGVVAMSSHTKTFTSRPFMREAKGGSLFGALRDQNAVAYDPSAKRLLAGGDDNKVWCFLDIDTPSPRAEKAFELDGNVEEILVAKDSSIVVALDTQAVHVLRPDGSYVSSLGPLIENWGSRPIRIELTPSNEVAAVLDGSLALLRPNDSSVTRSRDYPRLDGWVVSAGVTDTVLVSPPAQAPSSVAPYTVQRVAHGRPAGAVDASILGVVELAALPEVFPLPSAQAIVGFTASGSLRVAFVSNAGTLEAPIDRAAERPGSFARRGDDRAIGFLDGDGRLFEITDTPRAIREVGRFSAPPEGLKLVWDDDRRSWMAKDADGTRWPLARSAPRRAQ
ncbi:MAG: WD40 repeat domain-containing protein [Minicystis sp.]